MDQLCMEINTDVHGSLLGKQNLQKTVRTSYAKKNTGCDKKMIHHAFRFKMNLITEI